MFNNTRFTETMYGVDATYDWSPFFMEGDLVLVETNDRIDPSKPYLQSTTFLAEIIESRTERQNEQFGFAGSTSYRIRVYVSGRHEFEPARFFEESELDLAHRGNLWNYWNKQPLQFRTDDLMELVEFCFLNRLSLNLEVPALSN